MEFEGDKIALWQCRYAELVGWYKTHGNCNVPKAAGILGRWVQRQRENNKRGKLYPDHKACLDELGFVWNTHEAAWQAHFNDLCDYYSRHGHCCVPRSDPTLGLWVTKVRQNKRDNKLPDHRRQKLDDIGFIWNSEDRWMVRLEELREFRSKFGHSCVPLHSGELGRWVSTQRQRKRKGKLSAERARLLNEANFIWNAQKVPVMRPRMTRRDVTSVSLLSPAPDANTSPLYSQNAHGSASVIGNLVSALPHFQRDRSLAARARRASLLKGDVIPPISTLMHFTVKPSH